MVYAEAGYSKDVAWVFLALYEKYSVFILNVEVMVREPVLELFLSRGAKRPYPVSLLPVSFNILAGFVCVHDEHTLWLDDWT